jgi:hypothetical protein
MVCFVVFFISRRKEMVLGTAWDLLYVRDKKQIYEKIDHIIKLNMVIDVPNA